MLTPNASHYDRVISAWSLLLGENLHYGYFETGQETLDEATAGLTDRMLDRLGAPARVLDIGCGTGGPAIRAARRFGCGVVGISPSRECVRSARDAVPPDAAARVDFRLGDAQSLEFEDGSFDAALALESSHLIPDKSLLFSEARRVLRSGGRFVLCDIVLKVELGMRDVLARRDDFLLLDRVFGRAKMMTPRGYIEAATRNGFTVDETADLTSNTALTFTHWKRNAARYREEAIGRFGESSWQAFDDSIAVLQRFWQEGVLGYFMVALK